MQPSEVINFGLTLSNFSALAALEAKKIHELKELDPTTFETMKTKYEKAFKEGWESITKENPPSDLQYESMTLSEKKEVLDAITKELGETLFKTFLTFGLSSLTQKIAYAGTDYLFNDPKQVEEKQQKSTKATESLYTRRGFSKEVGKFVAGVGASTIILAGADDVMSHDRLLQAQAFRNSIKDPKTLELIESTARRDGIKAARQSLREYVDITSAQRNKTETREKLMKKLAAPPIDSSLNRASLTSLVKDAAVKATVNHTLNLMHIPDSSNNPLKPTTDSTAD